MPIDPMALLPDSLPVAVEMRRWLWKWMRLWSVVCALLLFRLGWTIGQNFGPGVVPAAAGGIAVAAALGIPMARMGLLLRGILQHAAQEEIAEHRHHSNVRVITAAEADAHRRRLQAEAVEELLPILRDES